ncbi:MAG: DUF3024 domain-containing protein [Deltaproteobacteria bacterium]|nr:DUF3024 domain-containing protein [Deltaproteobacteria bacterium]MBW2650255.1 DUF3024 domain-containing protein [Deltaproteobacteria bacterium]
MAFSEIELYKINTCVGVLCNKRAPESIRDQLRYQYTIEKHDVIIYEIRPRWNKPDENTRMPCAKLTFVRTQNAWKLYWHRANDKWYPYDPLKPSRDLVDLLAEIDEDPHGCFFG